MEKMLKADAIDERRRFLLDVGMPSGEVDKVLQSSLKEQVELVQDLVERIHTAGGRTDALRSMLSKGCYSKHSSLGFIDKSTNEEA